LAIFEQIIILTEARSPDVSRWIGIFASLQHREQDLPASAYQQIGSLPPSPSYSAKTSYEETGYDGQVRSLWDFQLPLLIVPS
jgi:hypothetical protein